MLIPPQNIHDLKTERANILPPLPMVARLIPILFYLSAFGTIVLVVVTFLQIGKTSGELQTVASRTARLQEQIAQSRAERTALETRTKHAVDLQQWVEGAIGVQPDTVAISRSIGEKSAITELVLSRDEKSSSQIQLSLKLQTADPAQLDMTVEAVRQSSFRPFSAKQSQDGNYISYEATLIRQVPTTTATP